MLTADQIKAKIVDQLPHSQVEVFDLTGTQDHWEVLVAAPQFEGLTRIQQHQRVMEIFSDELKTGTIHALSIKTRVLKPA